MRVAAVVADLMLFSRIEFAAAAAGASLLRVDSPLDLPTAESFDLVLVDLSSREPGWTGALRELAGSRIILFGPHMDLEAHAAAREAGLGPMWARSKLSPSSRRWWPSTPPDRTGRRRKSLDRPVPGY